MQTKFIPIDYDSFDLEGRNYVKITGRDEPEEGVDMAKLRFNTLQQERKDILEQMGAKVEHGFRFPI